MCYPFEWPFPKTPGPLYRFSSRIVCIGVGCFAKTVLCLLNRVKCVNRDRLVHAVDESFYKKRPFITVSNHYSELDDPLVFGLFDWKYILTRPGSVRWTPTAQEICFTNSILVWFFSHGRCVPIFRGWGVYQKGMDFCLDRLNKGDWVHTFPEGKVNITQTNMRIKWGIGRLIAESEKLPRVLPFHVVGMNEIWPLKSRFPGIGKKVSVVFGNEIHVQSLLDKLRNEGASPMQTRKALADLIQGEMQALKIKAEAMHKHVLWKKKT